jgi:hypothetical protein
MMNESRFNPNAIAKAARPPNTQQVQAIDIGKGCALLGFELRPAIDADGVAHAMVVAIGGKVSPITGIQPIGIVCGEVGKIPLAELHRHFGVVDSAADAPEGEVKPD